MTAPKPETDCCYCHRPVVKVDRRWEHFFLDDIVDPDGYYTIVICDPLLFNDRLRRVATPSVVTS
ncbi:hypothetical protein ABT369_39605 [Dactylosporangium sp. NPDC000244]|uniref:hypothetical protein n=1 Tax=Dactylosporangium sp. NPDC000244 TaxID=3154365 RepID=UPI003321155F